MAGVTEREFHAALEAEYAQPFSGWDFSRIRDRVIEDPLPWSYRRIVTEALACADALLDMGTGGGEFLDSLPLLPPIACATEGYAPNVPIARERLSRKNVRVAEIADGDVLPFESRSFDLVINRHESFSAREVARVAREPARFVTQQVGGMNGLDINASLGAPLPDDYGWCLLEAKESLLDAGFKISKCDEYIGKMRFYDIYSLAYYLKCIPWQIGDFSVDRYFRRLCLLNEEMEERGYADFLFHRFLIVAERSVP